MDPVTVNQLIVAGIGLVAGYLVRHMGLFGNTVNEKGGSAVAPPIVHPVVAPTLPAAPTINQGIVQTLEMKLHDLLIAVLQQKLLGGGPSSTNNNTVLQLLMGMLGQTAPPPASSNQIQVPVVPALDPAVKS